MVIVAGSRVRYYLRLLSVSCGFRNGCVLIMDDNFHNCTNADFPRDSVDFFYQITDWHNIFNNKFTYVGQLHSFEAGLTP